MDWKLSIGALLALASFSGTAMVVDTDEVAIVYRFGAVQRVAGSGLSFRLPRPLETDERLLVTEVRTVDTGLARLLTGDANLVELHSVAQYTIADPVAYATAMSDPDSAVAAVVECAVAATLGRSGVDPETFISRSALKEGIHAAAQEMLDEQRLGIRLEGLEIRSLSAPSAVAEAFNDVSIARGEKDTMVLSAESYASKLLPGTRGRGQEHREGARARAAELAAKSKADTQRFSDLLPTWLDEPESLRRRLVSQFWQEMRGKVDIRVATPNSEVVVEP
jgi:modulator of FtsH protease HflK